PLALRSPPGPGPPHSTSITRSRPPSRVCLLVVVLRRAELEEWFPLFGAVAAVEELLRDDSGVLGMPRYVLGPGASRWISRRCTTHRARSCRCTSATISIASRASWQEVDAEPSVQRSSTRASG